MLQLRHAIVQDANFSKYTTYIVVITIVLMIQCFIAAAHVLQGPPEL